MRNYFTIFIILILNICITNSDVPKNNKKTIKAIKKPKIEVITLKPKKIKQIKTLPKTKTNISTSTITNVNPGQGIITPTASTTVVTVPVDSVYTQTQPEITDNSENNTQASIPQDINTTPAATPTATQAITTVTTATPKCVLPQILQNGICVTPTQPQRQTPSGNNNYPIPIGIFNNTQDTITITNITLVTGSTYYDLTNSQTCTISNYANTCAQNSECNPGFCINKKCVTSLAPNSSWKGAYTNSSNDFYATGVIEYQINQKNYTSQMFTIDNQTGVSICFNTDSIKMFQWLSYNESMPLVAPVICSNIDPNKDTGTCLCTNYPDSTPYTGNTCKLTSADTAYSPLE